MHKHAFAGRNTQHVSYIGNELQNLKILALAAEIVTAIFISFGAKFHSLAASIVKLDSATLVFDQSLNFLWLVFLVPSHLLCYCPSFHQNTSPK